MTPDARETGAAPRGTDPTADGRAPPALVLEGVSKRFGWTWALREVDLTVERGSLVALTGPNGAGKTTLLRLLATLVHPTAGRARVLGMEVTERPEEVRRVVAFLPPQRFLYRQLTALENLRFACMMSGARRGEEELGAVLRRVGLGPAARERVDGYSSGMRQRLALARLLLRDVEVVLLDEPYASLDADGVALVDEVVADLLEEEKTVVMASHQWTESLRSAGRVVYLEEGRVGWEGTAGAFLRDRGEGGTERDAAGADPGDDAGGGPGRDRPGRDDGGRG